MDLAWLYLDPEHPYAPGKDNLTTKLSDTGASLQSIRTQTTDQLQAHQQTLRLVYGNCSASRDVPNRFDANYKQP